MVVKSPEPGLWLINETDECQTVQASELAGFNTGSYAEKPLRVARQMEQGLPWVVANDYSLLVLVRDSTKSLHCFADLSCVVATQQGVTELSLTDHDVVAATAQDFAACSVLGPGGSMCLCMSLSLGGWINFAVPVFNLTSGKGQRF